MRLVEQHQVKQKDPLFPVYDGLCFAAKNLYNASLYDIRQHYFETKKFKSWQTLRPEFVRDNNPDYRALPAKVSGTVLQEVGSGFKSFFKLLEKKNSGGYDKPVNIPKYLDKKGRHTITFPKDTISKGVKDLGNGLYEHTLCPNSLNLKIVSKQEKIDNVRIVPKYGSYVIEVVYTVPDVEPLPDNGRYGGIDLGVTNIVTLVSNVTNPLIWGGNMKTVNQFYNKKHAKQKTELPKGVKTSRNITRTNRKRRNKINNMLHNISREIVNHLVTKQINTLIIGRNKNWKQDTNLGKRNNQNFVNIPHTQLINLIKYKAETVGITVKTVNEAYTSKCSALDWEPVHKKQKYKGHRTHRGLYQTQNGTLINADVNGAINIIRKVVPDRKLKGIEDVAVHPVRIKSTKPKN